MWNSRPLPPFMEKSILDLHFDYLNPSIGWPNQIFEIDSNPGKGFQLNIFV